LTAAGGDAAPRIGGLATLPSRAATLARVVEAVLPQVDRLYLYFDRCLSVPAGFAGHPKIEPVLPAQVGDLAGAGKFAGLVLHPGACRYFGFDDDILYPPDYVAVLGRALRRHFGRAIVGLHGAFFRHPHRSYRDDRTFLHFRREVMADVYVDLLGTGTTAFDTRCFRFDPRDWPHRGMNDLMLAIEAVKQQVPRICIRRPKRFLEALAENQEDSIHRRLLQGDRLQTEVMQAALEAYPLAWHRWSIEAPPDAAG
jgi:hypothetical protein